MIQISENTTILHYRIKRLLATGGMSTIYLAHDTMTDREVAIKLVHHNEGDYYQRFRREAEAVAQLKHDHILPAFAHGEYESWFYMVMPYIKSGTLRDRLVAGPLAPQEAGKILLQLADAVQCAHEQGVIHRDIKPSNILMRDGEHVYLADFGLVRHIEEYTRFTQTGFLIGTPEYMAPEMTERPATQSCDIYALGIVLYQMLTGRVPFNGPSPVAICLKHVKERPLPPSKYNPALSPAIDSVVLRALAKNPTQRFRNAHELAEAFQTAINGTPSIYSIPTEKVFVNHTKTRIGLMAASILFLCLLPAALFVLSFSHQMPAATLLSATILNHGRSLAKPPISKPTPIVHKNVTTHPSGNTPGKNRSGDTHAGVNNRGVGHKNYKDNGGKGSTKGNPKGKDKGGGVGNGNGGGEGNGRGNGNGGDEGNGNGGNHSGGGD